jgi:hypothetical protein
VTEVKAIIDLLGKSYFNEDMSMMANIGENINLTLYENIMTAISEL